jgi:hypothetical protein
MKQTLYQRVLGDDFARLPPILRAFHAESAGGAACGTLNVVRGRGWVRRVACVLLRLPPVGEAIAVELQVQPEGERELWIRHFAGQRIETMQWQDGEFLVEKAGPLLLVFHLEATPEALLFHFQHNAIGPFKLPFALLRVDATARGMGHSWHIEVTIRTPLLGVLTTYSGEIAPC